LISKCQNKPTTKLLKSVKASVLKKVSLPTWPNQKQSAQSSFKLLLTLDCKGLKKKLVTCFTPLLPSFLKLYQTIVPFLQNTLEVEPFLTPVNLISPLITWKINKIKAVSFCRNLKKIAVLESSSPLNKSKKLLKKTLQTPIKSLKKLISSLRLKKSFHLLREKLLRISLTKHGNWKDSLKTSLLTKRKKLQRKEANNKKRQRQLKNKFSTSRTFPNLLAGRWNLH
jgi:hypothetical protein